MDKPKAGFRFDILYFDRDQTLHYAYGTDTRKAALENMRLVELCTGFDAVLIDNAHQQMWMMEDLDPREFIVA